MRKGGRAAAHRARKIAGEIRDRRLYRGAFAPPRDRVIHPRAAALRVARVEVHVELPDELARGIADLIEAHVLVPGRRTRRVDAHAVERLGNAEKPLHCHFFREVLLHLLLGERVAADAQLLGRIRDVPGFERIEPELASRKIAQLGHVLIGKRARPASQIFQEGKDLLGRLGHLRHERNLGIVAIAKELRRLAAQLDDARNERRIVPVRLAKFGRARHALPVHRLPQRPVLRVLHYRHIGGRMQRELPAGLAVLFSGFARGLEHIRRDAADAALVHHDREGLGRVEQVFRKPAAKTRKLLLDLRETRLAIARQLGAAQPEVAQRVVDDAAPCGAECRVIGRSGERLVLLEECLILPELGPVLGELRQVGVVRLAQLRAVEHRVQVRDLPPGAADALVRVLERRDEALPSDRRREHALDGGAAVGEELLDGGCYVFRLELREARQPGKIHKRVVIHKSRIHSEARAARTQFSSSMAMVIGPTPPGTGVIQPATSLAAAKSTSPQSEPSGRRFTPTSITQAPGLTIAPVTSFARPTAATRMSALRAMSCRSRLFEWHTVTVASRARSSSASGLPTIFERPMTTARAPANGTPAWSSKRMTPAGVHGSMCGTPATSAPRLAA